MEIHLLAHNIIFGISAIMCISVILFIIFNTKSSTTNTLMVLTMTSILIFVVSHVFGVNIIDPSVSRNVLMFNMSLFFIGAFTTHTILAYNNKAHEKRYMIAFLYITSLFFVIWFSINPDLFLLPSVPKMYFTNYYVPGALNWTRMAFLYGICFPYALIELLKYFYKSTEIQIRKKYLYFFFAIITAAILGFIPNFLVYNIPVDPIWGGVFMAFFASIFIYAGLKYELFDVRIIAKQAFEYTVSILVVGGFIILFDYINRIVQDLNPSFPSWAIPLLISVIIIAISMSVWRKIRESDLLKYEFITTVTHTFRTPLTHIKWASENLSNSNLSAEDKIQLDYIREADEKLVELTGLLMNISETENNEYQYTMSSHCISKQIDEMVESYRELCKRKNIDITKNIDPDLYANFDESRIKFVMQTLIENAINYTPAAGNLTISLKQNKKETTLSVSDSGIGIAKEELPKLFSKFYRGHSARLTDTEGVGIGLYLSKQIMARHGGNIWAVSDGLGKGSTFSFSLKKE